MDDAYIGGARPGPCGRGAEGKTPFVAAVATTDQGKPDQIILRRVTAFSKVAIRKLAGTAIAVGAEVVSDGLACFQAVSEVGCDHLVIKTGGGRKAAKTPAFKWVNTVLGNIKAAWVGIPRLREKAAPGVTSDRKQIHFRFMTLRGYLCAEDRADLIALARAGSAAHRLARRATALVLLDEGWSFERVAAALFVDDETIRRWHRLFIEDGLEGLTRFDSGGSCPRLAQDQEAELRSWIVTSLPRSLRQVGAYIERQFGIVYEMPFRVDRAAASSGLEM